MVERMVGKDGGSGCREHGIRDGSGREHLTHGALSAVLAVVPERDDDAVAVDTSCSHGVARAGEGQGRP